VTHCYRFPAVERSFRQTNLRSASTDTKNSIINRVVILKNGTHEAFLNIENVDHITAEKVFDYIDEKLESYSIRKSYNSALKEISFVVAHSAIHDAHQAWLILSIQRALVSIRQQFTIEEVEDIRIPTGTRKLFDIIISC
jgi:hypothetical protein